MSGMSEPAKVDRREERRAKSWPALIRLEDGRELPCVVKDVSRSGARIILPTAFPMTRTFLLRIDERGLALQVRLAWRRDSACGVQIEKITRLPRQDERAVPLAVSAE